MDIGAVIDSLGGPSSVAKALGLPNASTATYWTRRGSIPVRYWPALIDFAAERGVSFRDQVEALEHCR